MPSSTASPLPTCDGPLPSLGPPPQSNAGLIIAGVLALNILGWIVAMAGVVRGGRGLCVAVCLSPPSGIESVRPPRFFRFPRSQAALSSHGVGGSTTGFIWWGVVSGFWTARARAGRCGRRRASFALCPVVMRGGDRCS